MENGAFFNSITFRTIFFVQYFSYNYFSRGLFVQVLFVQIQGGGGKSPRVRGGISSHKLLLRRGLFAPLASNFAPPLLYLYEKYLYEKSVRKVRTKSSYEKYLYENNCTKSDTASSMSRPGVIDTEHPRGAKKMVLQSINVFSRKFENIFKFEIVIIK